MKVLIISANTLPASPSGPAYIAGAVQKAGHSVQVFERLFATEMSRELADRLHSFQPDVVGISIRLVFGDELDASAPLGTRHTDLRPSVKEILEVVRQNSNARIVLGGPGFNYYAADWLAYLGHDYGIRGEGEVAFPLFLERLAQGGDIYTVPGCVFQKDGKYHAVPPLPVEDLNSAALPAYELFALEQYAQRNITPTIFTKRGCAYACTYCPYSKLEGKRYRLKSPQRVLDEIRLVLRNAPGRRVIFCDNSFNAPQRHARELCQAFIDAKLDFQWGTGDLKPAGVSDEFCRLMEDSGCFYANLAIESASGTMLRRMKRGYTVRQVREALESLCRSNIPFGASLLFGAPGETPETIHETLQVLGDYHIPLGVWVTVGVYLWTDYQDIVGELRQAGQLPEDLSLFSGVVYLSPALSRDYMEDLLVSLRSRPGYQVQVNKPSELWRLTG